jgi:hypothetical protein
MRVQCKNKWYLPFAIGAYLAATPALSFENTNLDDIATKAEAALGADFKAQTLERAVSLSCDACASITTVIIQIGRQTDGTEERVRSGETTIEKLEAQCQANEASCRIERADIGGAVGWQSTYSRGDLGGSTLVLIKDGDLLTVRSIAASAEKAKKNLSRLKKSVILGIVGN